MKFKKPKFWDYNKPNILSYLFFPVSLLLTILKTLKNLTTKKKKYSKIKTICVGNIYIGGTGKTPLSIKISELLNSKGIKTTVPQFIEVNDKIVISTNDGSYIEKAKN